MMEKKKDMRDVLGEIADDEVRRMFHRAARLLGKMTDEWGGGVWTIYEGGIPAYKIVGGYKYELPTRKKVQ